jgi:hypothetical protein
MRRTARRLVAAGAVATIAATACEASGLPELEPGRVTAAELADVPEAPDAERWVVTVRLADRSVNGQQLVVVELARDAARCTDGGGADLADLAAGTEVELERADLRDVARARPPLITGSRLLVDC